MCGIYSVFLKNTNDGEMRVLEGLKRLEYRGYDSWGVAVLEGQKIEIEKHTGKIGEVKKVNLPKASVGLGHTRWATHGGVTKVNAHPHAASDNSFVLVQNGVVENYQELKATLEQKGYTFVSQTDTEVIVRLIEEVRGKRELNFEIVAEAFTQLGGRNTIGVLTKQGSIYAIRNGSPLIVGKDVGQSIYLSSDVLSIAADATEYVALESGQGVSIESGELTFHQLGKATKVQLKFQPIDVETTKLDKAGFAHFMLKEIHEQTEILTAPLRTQEAEFAKLVAALKNARHVYTVGAGSADFVSGQIAFFLREAGINATAVKAYESRSYEGLVGADDICLAVSQSGETADTVEVVEWMRVKKVQIASIVNMPGSTLTRLSDFPFMLQIGPEIGIASTKAVTSQMVWGRAVAELIKGGKLSAFRTAVEIYQKQLTQWFSDTALHQKMQRLATTLQPKKDLFILGRGQMYMPALESALKLKEISYIHAEGFAGGELKHGVIALIEKGTPVLCLVANDKERPDILSSAAEVKARGAFVIGLSVKRNELFDEWIELPNNDHFSFISSILPAQLLTYYIAVAKGLDPDKPRNLAKSVTVK